MIQETFFPSLPIRFCASLCRCHTLSNTISHKLSNTPSNTHAQYTLKGIVSSIHPPYTPSTLPLNATATHISKYTSLTTLFTPHTTSTTSPHPTSRHTSPPQPPHVTSPHLTSRQPHHLTSPHVNHITSPHLTSRQPHHLTSLGSRRHVVQSQLGRATRPHGPQEENTRDV